MSTPTTRSRNRRKPNGRTAAMSTAATELLPMATVLRELGIARSTFYDWVSRGRAPRCIKYPNGKLYVRRSDLDDWLAEQEVGA